MNSLPRLKSGLLRHDLDQQVLVYDSHDDSVHLLDPTTGYVFDLLQEGSWGPDTITGELGRRLDVTPNEGLLFLAINELQKANLLESDSVESSSLLPDVTRRDLVRKLALTGAAALLIPAVATLTARSAYAATNVANSGLCASSAECVSGFCYGPTGRCAPAGCATSGATCANDAACCSNYQPGSPNVCSNGSNKVCTS
jgi:hypothetical protein